MHDTDHEEGSKYHPNEQLAWGGWAYIYNYTYICVCICIYVYLYVYIHIHILRGGEINNPHWTRQQLWKWGSGSKCKWWWWSYKQVIKWVSMVISHKKLHIASYGHIMMWTYHDKIISQMSENVDWLTCSCTGDVIGRWVCLYPNLQMNSDIISKYNKCVGNLCFTVSMCFKE